MLEYLRIQGLGLVDDISLEFGAGMNAVTGETGAGKSFLIKAVGFVLGEKMSADIVRKGCDKARVEALFTRPSAEPEAPEEEIVLRRELSASTGRSRFFMNGSLVTQDIVRELRGELVFHVSQHGQQKLLQPAFQAALVDSFLESRDDLLGKDAVLRELRSCAEQKEALLERIAALSEKRELLEMQQREIDKVAPEEGEEEKLLELSSRLRDGERLRERYEAGLELIMGGEGGGLRHTLAELDRLLDALSENDEGFAQPLESLRNFSEEVRELESRFRRIPDASEGIDPDAVESRLYAFSQLKRRLHRSIPEILSLRQEIDSNLSFLDACGIDRHRLEKQERELAKRLFELTGRLNEQRENAASRFCSALTENLKGLGFSDLLRVVPKADPAEIWPEVRDQVKTICPACMEMRYRLLWAPNPGQPPQPLDRIASGGELSRFMLGVVGLRRESAGATLIFDEIDAGIGGMTLNKVSDRLHALASERQLMVVTHWPQLASGADQHYRVVKEFADDKTFTRCSQLSEGGTRRGTRPNGRENRSARSVMMVRDVS